MHYYQHHIGDYERDTATLTLAEHGAYGKLMRSYYATERPLPCDVESLWRICGAMTRPERLAVSLVAEKFFRLEDGVLRHKRIDVEIATYHDQLDTASRAGRASAEARQRKRNARSTPVDIPLQREANAPPNGTATNQEPITNNHTEVLSPAREAYVSDAPPDIDAVLGYAKGNSAGVLRTDVCMAWMDDRASTGWRLKGQGGNLYEFNDWRADLRKYHRIFLENERDKNSRQSGSRQSRPRIGERSDSSNDSKDF